LDFLGYIKFATEFNCLGSILLLSVFLDWRGVVADRSPWYTSCVAKRPSETKEVLTFSRQVLRGLGSGTALNAYENNKMTSKHQSAIRDERDRERGNT
jgi:hypothetical protein